MELFNKFAVEIIPNETPKKIRPRIAEDILIEMLRGIPGEIFGEFI